MLRWRSSFIAVLGFVVLCATTEAWSQQKSKLSTQSTPTAPKSATTVKKSSVKKGAKKTSKKHVTKDAVPQVFNIETSDASATFEYKQGEIWVNGQKVTQVQHPQTDEFIVHVNTHEPSTWSPAKDAEISHPQPYTSRAMLGVYADEFATYDGASLTGVMHNSPAEVAGLQAGDLIKKINNKKVTDARDLVNAVFDCDPGELVTVTYERFGALKSTTLEMGASAPYNRHHSYEYKIPDLHGNKRLPAPMLHTFMYNNMQDYFDRAPELGIEGVDAPHHKGVRIQAIKPQSAASYAGLETGDLITRLDYERVHNIFDMQDILNSTWPNKKIIIEFERKGVVMETSIRFVKEKYKKNI